MKTAGDAMCAVRWRAWLRFAGWQAILLAGAVPVLLDMHGRLLKREWVVMTAEDRAITLGVMLVVYWAIFGLLFGGGHLLARRGRAVGAAACAVLGLIAICALTWASDGVFFLMHLGCYGAGACDGHPVFSRVMYALSATSSPPGPASWAAVAVMAALAYARGRRQRTMRQSP